MQAAKSFVMNPDSIVSIHTSSKLFENLARAGLLSNFARCWRPLVQANIEAIGFVEVSLPMLYVIRCL